MYKNILVSFGSLSHKLTRKFFTFSNSKKCWHFKMEKMLPFQIEFFFSYDRKNVHDWRRGRGLRMHALQISTSRLCLTSKFLLNVCTFIIIAVFDIENTRLQLKPVLDTNIRSYEYKANICIPVTISVQPMP